jgi:hypothetical protein
VKGTALALIGYIILSFSREKKKAFKTWIRQPVPGLRFKLMIPGVQSMKAIYSIAMPCTRGMDWKIPA